MPIKQGILVGIVTILLTAFAFLILLAVDRMPVRDLGPAMDTDTEQSDVLSPTKTSSSPFGTPDRPSPGPTSSRSTIEPIGSEPLAANDVIVKRAQKHVECRDHFEQSVETKIPAFAASVDESWGELDAQHGVFFSAQKNRCVGVVMLMSKEKGLTAVRIFDPISGETYDMDDEAGLLAYQEFILSFEDLDQAGLK